ncbi:MAG: 4-alpha-glucanotransferase [Nitrospirae bacterium]|nr:4-alpha-glucanotransferase [Nitrospirota bacterium]
MPDYDELINRLSDTFGIIPEYWDIFGKQHVTSIDTKKAILSALKLDVGTTDSLASELSGEQDKAWRGFIGPVKVISVNSQPFTISVYVPAPEGEEHRLAFSCYLGNGSGVREELALPPESLNVRDQRFIGAARYVRIDITDSRHRDIGYYSATVMCKHPDKIFPGGKSVLQKTCRIIITPDACYIPPKLDPGKTWGLSLNLYSLKSLRNWGVGDFTDLDNIVRYTAGLKGGFVGINPLHAIPNMMPHGISPYSPVSRFYKNFIYLDMDAVPEVRASESAREIMNSDEFKKELRSLQTGDLLQYEKIAFLKKRILRHAFDFFHQSEYKKNTPRGITFKNYIEEEGAALDSFALFSALSEHISKELEACAWQDWPEEFLSPSGKAVKKFRTSNGKELLFHKYVQWCIDEQHRKVAKQASDLGMAIGLYHDLAIGSIGGGCNSWNYQNIVAENIDVGAPPDDFNPNGQNWGFPPLIPGMLKETGYEFFIQVIRKNMKYNGALRIDHALGLFRLFWIPCGMPAEKGAYVTYPTEDLLRIIALESVINRTMVIAEDLGTVGDNVHEELRKFQMLSYRLFYFERNYPDPSFTSPEQYPPLALCAITTHDLPTIYGYWSGRDIEEKKNLNIYHDDELNMKRIDDRERDKMLLLKALKSRGIIPENFQAGPSMTHELCLAIYEYLARTPCKLVAVSLDDVIGTLDQQNMPGITGSYPNWMRKTPLGLEQISTDRRFFDLAEMFRRNNR